MEDHHAAFGMATDLDEFGPRAGALPHRFVSSRIKVIPRREIITPECDLRERPIAPTCNGSPTVWATKETPRRLE